MIKYLKTNNIVAVLVLLAVTLFQGCSNDESFDVTGDPTSYVFIRGASQFADKPSNSYVFNIVRTPIGATGDKVEVKIPVRVNLPLSTNTTVTAQINNALIEKYNADNGTDFKAFPEGSVEMIKNTVSIRAGAFKSDDSLHFAVSEEHYMSFTEPGYLLPLNLVQTSAGVISTKESSLWTFVNSEFIQINAGAGLDDILGVIGDRTGWSISSTDEPSLNFASILDGSLNSEVIFASTANPSITVDMGSVNKVSGLRFAPYRNSSSTYRITSVKVEISNDNYSWELLGTASPLTDNGTYQLVGFYEGIDTRYIRLTFAWRYGAYGQNYRRLSELDVFVVDTPV